MDLAGDAGNLGFLLLVLPGQCVDLGLQNLVLFTQFSKFIVLGTKFTDDEPFLAPQLVVELGCS